MASTADFMIDFRKGEAPTGRLRVKPGIRAAHIGKCKIVASKSSDNKGIALPLTFKDKGKTKKLVETLWLTPKCYHRFREVLEACGKKAPSRTDIRKIARAISDEDVFVNIVDDEDETGKYETKSTVAFTGGFLSEDDVDEDDEEEDVDEDDEEEDVDEDDEDEDDEDDEDEDDEDDEDEDDEDDEDEAPARRRRKKAPVKKAAKKPSSKRRKRKSSNDDIDLDDF
jgi:hypothetical protein